MIRTARLWPLPGLVAARLGTPLGPAVVTAPNTPNLASDDTGNRAERDACDRYTMVARLGPCRLTDDTGSGHQAPWVKSP
jgi:hypothetical protein